LNPLSRWLTPFRYTALHPKYWRFVADFLKFRKLSHGAKRRRPLEWRHRYPMLEDRTQETEFDAHYIYHPAWAARILAQTRPARHIDIAGSLSFATMVSAFLPVEFYDLRPARVALSNLESRAADLLNLPFPDSTVASLSCMHVVEHVGLGRYGDPLDPLGDIRAMAELTRVLASGGSLFFVVPVGRPRVCFNAHRIYDCAQIEAEFAALQVRQFCLVDDEGRFTVDADRGYANSQEYGCGCWWFTK